MARDVVKSLDGFLTGLGGNEGFRVIGGTQSAAPSGGEKRPSELAAKVRLKRH